MQEEWRPVSGYEGLYEVSDRGNVRSICFRNRMVHKKLNTPRLLRLSVGTKGYLFVQLCRDGKRAGRFVHRLVLESFVGSCPSGHAAAHLNGKRKDNRIANLKWATYKENESHKIIHRTVPLGEQCNCAKLTADRVRTIRGLHGDGVLSKAQISRAFAISETTVGRIIARITWRHI